MWRGRLVLLFLLIGTILGSGAIGFWLSDQLSNNPSFETPFIPQQITKPLLAYSIPALSQKTYQPSQIVIEDQLADEETYSSYVFSYVTLGKRMTGHLHLPKPLPTNAQAIVMLRGYVPLEIYQTGVGTQNAAKQLAENGFVTVAPDFFGYGDSDPEPTDEWQARFEKPITVIELLQTLESKPIIISLEYSQTGNSISLPIEKVGIWGHSNGGQIALSTLEIVQRPIPTALWAPVTAPFPYSILFFSDEVEDEGKAMRKWLSIFEDTYDVFEFSVTKHLDRLRGPLQIHHGTADEAALVIWSDEFIDKLGAENERREQEKENAATMSAEINPALEPIEFDYYTYQGADHNLQPGWNTVVERDIEFFQKYLQEN